MKKSARNRIIIWSIVSVLLIGLLVGGIIGIRNIGSLNFKIFSFNTAADDLDNMSTGSASLDKEDVKSIEINWLSGEIEIRKGTSDKVEISESKSYENDSDNAMRWGIDDGELKIYESKKAYQFFQFFSFGSQSKSKKLTLTLPEDYTLEEININSASADVTAEALKADFLDVEEASGNICIDGFSGTKADINNVSGKLELYQVISDEIEVETVSGECSVSGKIDIIEAKTVSGSLDINTADGSKKIEANTVSGKVNIGTNCGESGFTANYSSVSGGFSCDLSGMNKDGKFIYGSGEADYNISTVSGDIEISAVENTLTQWLLDITHEDKN